MSPIPEQLPPCEGPKLTQFQYYNSTFQWLERLDENREDDDVTSSKGYVFKARIGSREYAIKVVCNNQNLLLLLSVPVIVLF